MSLEHKQEMLSAILKEIGERTDYIVNETITTIYIGGGTPSVYSPQELGLLIKKVAESYTCKLDEITVEVNPDDIDAEYLQQLKEIGVNRLSIGIQSFIDRDLQLMNRRHDAKSALEVVPLAQKHGFNNISIDLIYGVPGQTLSEWENNLDLALGLNVQHISSYHLSIEPKTVFGNKMKRGLFHPVDDELSEQLYSMLESKLASGGFQHYEISNFAKPGYISKHNSGYWTYNKYIGVGPSAHSFDGASRRWNIANNNKYLKALSENSAYWDFEKMSLNERYNEYILTSLRTSWGLNKKNLLDNFGKELVDYFSSMAQPHIDKGFLVDNGTFIYIPTSRFLVADGIMSDLFYVTE